jgi:hypothetical protein
MAKKKHDPKAKAKRQKVIAAVGGVLLLGVLGIQVPRTLKMMHPQDQSAQSSSPSTAASTTSGTPALAPPSLDGSTGGPSGASGASPSSAVTTADGISDPAGPLPPDAGQLVSFSQFKSKDPFKQQISTGCGAASSQAPGVVCASGSGGSSTTAKSGPAKIASGLPSPAASKPARKLSFSKANTATISVNGLKSTVSVGKTFPSAAPVFSLVSLSGSSAKIGIAGGSYESGAATVTLARGKTVTLLNTADGTRYVLRLVAAA